MPKRRNSEHIYKHGGMPHVMKEFEKEYGTEKGDRIYGAVVGKLYRNAHHGKNWNQKQ